VGDLTHLVVAFAVSFAAVFVVALLYRIGGKKPNYLNIIAIPIGITAAEALRLVWPMSNVVFPFVVGAAVGVMVYAAQFVGGRRGV
jgi:hypothetical protein